ncbi:MULTISPECIES: BadF/BadG/BcrA/BcrD ATPase family protein [unclassified Ruegeria]|uniref:BadF/BadG/BcrA/BcrD ATPase family protein n=1 Tax=unclassified Ruegeria TaxID=2625375 RepID=UPI001ADA01EA|nr:MULTISPECIES: BadF/BadG/BcrA/BcrD ATPase family protein [unclassified Ruegeria]MBO9411152.1 ATPase [Ruegeria sp. R8_1]MBO9415353.1 ATPase [Ruegeria sp. R8_2]
MTESQNTAFLAVDGGGTRCRVAAEVDGVVHSVETGAANVSTDFEGGVRQIAAGLSELAAGLDTSVAELVRWPAFIGLAGVTGDSVADRLRVALDMPNARIEDDRPAAVRGALGSSDGLIAHCGTGSFLAVQINGDIRLAGGWGPILGDEASAQWVGRRALSEVLNTEDQIQAKSSLTQAFSNQFGGVAGIVEFAGQAAPGAFGALAPQVTAAAADGDQVARQVMQAGADYIGGMAKRLGWKAGLTLCLTGGIGPHYADYLPADMQAALRPAQGEPLIGALALAKEDAHEHC